MNQAPARSFYQNWEVKKEGPPPAIYGILDTPVLLNETTQVSETITDIVPLVQLRDLRLKWSGKFLPTIGQRIVVTMNKLGHGTVTAFFTEAGFLGVEVFLDEDTRPAWHKKQSPGRPFCLVYGIEIAEEM